MSITTLIILAIFAAYALAILLAFALLVLILPVWCYYAGFTRVSPVPQTIETLINPPPAPPAPPKPTPPSYPCPACRKPTAWAISADSSQWLCTNDDCEGSVPGPNPELKS